jgi:hypothetical protein
MYSSRARCVRLHVDVQDKFKFLRSRIVNPHLVTLDKIAYLLSQPLAGNSSDSTRFT